MSKYKLSHLDLTLSLIHVLNKIEVPPLSVYELCQLRDNLYLSDICIDMTDITAMLNDVCTQWPTDFTCLFWLFYCIEMDVKMCTSYMNTCIYVYIKVQIIMYSVLLYQFI